VVFLADTTSSPTDTQRLRLIHLPQGDADAQGPGVVVWAGKKVDDPPPVAAARSKMLGDTEDEYRRLLYVAMTRAADRLIVGGCMPGNAKTLRKSCWYDLIGKGLENSGLRLQGIETADGVVKRYARLEDAAPAAVASAAAMAATIELPPWLRQAAPSQTSDDAFVRPSQPAESEGRSFRGGESVRTRAQALRRGTLVHRMLQSLPDVPRERRRDAAQGYLVRNAADWSDGERDALVGRVMALIENAHFAPVFATGSRAEVAIVGRLERPAGPPALVSGQIDRLVVNLHEILIVDFKTNQAPPAVADLAPAAYVRQLALYRALLSKLYPQRLIRTALLWTETPELMEISAAALDAELASLFGGEVPA
jgi:ATP-dependent helicase/nuclease subunit A